MPAIALVQLLPEVYPDPHAFRPERFLEGQPEPYTWIPFGGGIRRCLGAAFATFEMKVVLRTILSRAKLRAPTLEPERARVRNVTVVPAEGAAAILEQRLPATAALPGERAEPAAAAPL
jgi:cytochrome P450